MSLIVNFVTAPCNANVGAIYQNNLQQFTVITTVSNSIVLSTQSNGTPSAAGQLTLVSGSGDPVIAFSGFTIQTPRVLGISEGILVNNKEKRNVGPLINVKQLREDYLYGIALNDDQGNPMSDDQLQIYLDNATSWLEHKLDIHVIPYMVVEDKDYRLNDYADWGYLYLNEYPVISFVQMEMVYFRDINGVPETIQVIPNNWIRMQNNDGIIRLIPNARFPANLQVDQTGNFFPEVLRSNMVPNLLRLTYWAGFNDGAVPMIINQAIGLLASIQAMSLAGPNVWGAGVSATSLNLDGLSQNISTTNNSDSAAFSSVISEYKKLLFGQEKDDKNGIVDILLAYYKGQQIGVI